MNTRRFSMLTLATAFLVAGLVLGAAPVRAEQQYPNEKHNSRDTQTGKLICVGMPIDCIP